MVNNQLKIKSTRVINMSKNKKDLWTDDLDSDRSSLESDYNTTTGSSKSRTTKTSTNETSESSRPYCCLICSILPSLSNVNCCDKHLSLLTNPIPSYIHSMMSPQVKNLSQLECHCRAHSSKTKRMEQFRSLSLLSSESERRKKNRSGLLSSFNTEQTNGLTRSSNVQRSSSPLVKSRKTRSNSTQISLSSSLIMNNNNNARKRSRTLSSRNSIKRKRQKVPQTESTITRDSTEQPNNPTTVDTDSDILDAPRISLKRVIHVKDDDDDDEPIMTHSQITLNMAEATEQMINLENPRPKILLKRICLD